MQNLVSFSSLLASIILFLLSIFVYLKDPRRSINISFSIYFTALAIWSFGIFGLVSGFEPYIIIWQKIMSVGVVFIPASFLFFSYNFLGNKYKPVFPVVIGSFIISFFYLAATFTKYFFMGVIKVEYGYVGQPHPGIIFPFFVGYVVAAMIYGHYLVFKELISSKGQRKNQLFFVFTASAVFTIGALAVVPTLIGTVILGGFPLWNFTNIFYGFLIAYAITKERLMNIPIAISRTLAWALTVLFLGAIYTAFVLHYRTYISNRIDLPFFIFSIIYGIFVGESFQRIRFFLQTTTDKAFIKSWYDYRRVLRDAAADLGRALTREDITKVLYPVFQNDIDVSEAHLLFHDSKTDDYIELREGGAEQTKILILGKDAAPIKLLLNNKDRIIYEGKAYIPSFHENNLIALIILGKKRSEDEYSEDDYELFRTISEYVAIVLEYIVKPYEEVKEKFEETERKLIETEKQLERSQRLASLATMAAGVAHEIRNPLGIIHSKTEKLDDAPRDIEYLRAFKESVLKNSKRISSIITSMLDLTKVGEKKMEKVNLNEIIESTFQLLTFNDIKLEKKYENIPGITGDPEELKRIFINLFSNAIEAMPGGGYLTVSTYLIEEDDIKKVCVDISDTGRGIAKENLVKIFDPFFSGRHEGVGLGLSIVYRIVREHSGEISVKSEIGKGSTFSLKFNVVPS